MYRVVTITANSNLALVRRPIRSPIPQKADRVTSRAFTKKWLAPLQKLPSVHFYA